MDNQTDKSIYIHGASQEEQERLSLLNDLLNERSLHEIALQGGEKILDVGSGLGQFSRALAKASGVKVVGVERDQQQLTTALKLIAKARETELVDFRAGDALDLPLTAEEWGCFDLAHTRFVLEHISTPEKVVTQMFKAIRVGGRVFLADDDHFLFRITPNPPGFAALWEAYCRSYDRLGNDPYIGSRLVTLLYEAGLSKIRNGVIFFGDCAGNATFQAYVENLIGILLGAKSLILEQQLLSRWAFEQGIAGLQRWRYLPDAALWYTVCYAEGQKLPIGDN